MNYSISKFKYSENQTVLNFANICLPKTHLRVIFGSNKLKKKNKENEPFYIRSI